MATHTDTAKLLPYNPRTYPNIPGGETQYLNAELSKLSDAINKLVAVTKLLEARMNTNGLT
jgi:hypothetical protein